MNYFSFGAGGEDGVWEVTWGGPACRLGVLRVLPCCPKPSWAGCGLAPAGRIVHPSEILIVILQASAAGWHFQDSRNNSRNLPLSWQPFCWPDLGRLDWEKTRHKGANRESGQSQPASLSLPLPKPKGKDFSSPFGNSVEDRSQPLMPLYFDYAYLL